MTLAPARPRWPRVGLLLVVGAAAFAAFLPALAGEFVNWDDNENFLKNHGYRGLGLAQLRWMLTSTLMGHWIPLTWLTLGLNHALGGMNPLGYHLLNQLLHAANALVFCLVAHRLLVRVAGDGAPARWGAALAGLVFAVHPLRAESVAWITERRDVLCGLFYLLTVLAYVDGTGPERRLAGRARLACTLLLAAALLSKSMAMTLPATLLLLDAYPLRRRALGARALVREKVPLLALSAAAAAIALVAVRRGASFTGYGEYGLEARVALVAYNLWFYPARMAWPVGLSPLYELPGRLSLAEWRFLGPLLGVLAVTAGLGALRRRWPAGLAAWTHSAIVLAPVSGVVHAGYQLAHDRYSYLAGLGFAVLVGAALAGVLRAREAGRIGRPTAVAVRVAAMLVVVLLAIGAWEQSRIWRSGEALWTAAVGVDPACALCHNNLGQAFLARERWREAEYEFREAIALRPERPSPHNNLGTALAYQRRYPEAAAAFGEAIRLSTRQPDAFANLGALHARQGRYDEAIPLLRRALVMEREFPGVRANLGHSLKNRGARLANAGQLEEALASLREAVALLPEDAEARRNLGQALVSLGRPQDALAPLEHAVTLNPRGPQERFWLARAYLAAGQPDRAEPHRRALADLAPSLASQLP